MDDGDGVGDVDGVGDGEVDGSSSSSSSSPGVGVGVGDGVVTFGFSATTIFKVEPDTIGVFGERDWLINVPSVY